MTSYSVQKSAGIFNDPQKRQLIRDFAFVNSIRKDDQSKTKRYLNYHLDCLPENFNYTSEEQYERFYRDKKKHARALPRVIAYIHD